VPFIVEALRHISGQFITYTEYTLGPVDNHLEAMRAATRFQHAV
jgi:hypothetical protein